MLLALYGSIAWRHPLGLGKVIEWASEAGWDALDARGLSLGVPGDPERNRNAFGYDMLGPDQCRPSARRELRSRLEDAGISLICIYSASSINLPGPAGDAFRELFRDYLRLAADLGVPWIRSINNTTSGVSGETEMSPAEAYDRTVAGTRDVGRLAADLGVGIMLENNENTVTPDARSLLRLKTDAGDACRIGIAYDAVNAYFQEHDPADQMRELSGNIDALHAKNVRRHETSAWSYIPRGRFSYEWTALAGGDLDWRELIALARRQGFDGSITYEYCNPFKGMPRGYWDTLPEPDEAARTEREYLREQWRAGA